MEGYIKWIDEIGIHDLKEVGGWGAGLGELYREEFSVPAGFTVHVRAYESFLKENDLIKKARTHLTPLDRSDPDGLKRRAEAFRTVLQGAEIPAEVNAGILKALERLHRDEDKAALLAVRSSLITEDLSHGCLPGKQDAFLNIRKEEELLKHIRECFVSAWEYENLFHVLSLDVDPFSVKVACLVQKLFRMGTAGTLSTWGAASSQRKEMVIDACWGLGETVLSGTYDSDRFVLQRGSLELLEQQVGSKEKMVVPNEEGSPFVVELDVPEEKAEMPCLSWEQIQELAEAGIAIERCFGEPQEIQWAFENGDLHILKVCTARVSDTAGEITSPDGDSPDKDVTHVPLPEMEEASFREPETEQGEETGFAEEVLQTEEVSEETVIRGEGESLKEDQSIEEQELAQVLESAEEDRWGFLESIHDETVDTSRNAEYVEELVAGKEVLFPENPPKEEDFTEEQEPPDATEESVSVFSENEPGKAKPLKEAGSSERESQGARAVADPEPKPYESVDADKPEGSPPGRDSIQNAPDPGPKGIKIRRCKMDPYPGWKLSAAGRLRAEALSSLFSAGRRLKRQGGPIQERDEFHHNHNDSHYWNESYYFNFSDPERRVGGFSRIGMVPNQTMAIGILYIYLPDGGVLMLTQSEPCKTSRDELVTGLLRYERVRPLWEWRILFQGKMLYLPDPRKLPSLMESLESDPVEAEKVLQFKEASVDLVFKGWSPCHDFKDADPRFVAERFVNANSRVQDILAVTKVASEHYEQVGSWSGEIVVDGERMEILGSGHRDHSWGERDWKAPERWTWLTAQFGNDFGFNLSRVVIKSLDVYNGYICRSGQNHPLRRAWLETEFEQDGLTQKRVLLRLQDTSGWEAEIEGSPQIVVPLTLKEGAHKTLVNEAFTEYRWKGRTGYGISEYLHQV